MEYIFEIIHNNENVCQLIKSEQTYGTSFWIYDSFRSVLYIIWIFLFFLQSLMGSASSTGSSAIFSLLLTNIIFLASSLYNIEQVNKKYFLMSNRYFKAMYFFIHLQALQDIGIGLFFCIECVGIGLFWPYLLCDSATSATLTITKLGSTAFSSEWYKYPPNLRKQIAFIIARSQEPVYFTGLKIIKCTLEVFMKVRFVTIHAFFLNLKYASCLFKSSSTIRPSRITSCSGAFQICNP